MVSDLDHKEEMVEQGAPEYVASAHTLHTTHSILQSAHSLDQLEERGPATPPMPTTPPCSSSSMCAPSAPAPHQRPSVHTVQLDRSQLGSPRSTRSKVSFTGSESTVKTGGHTAPIAGKVGAPTTFQTSCGSQELSSRLYTSDNTKPNRRRRR